MMLLSSFDYTGRSERGEEIILEWPHTKCAYEVPEVASLSDSSVLVALQQISYSDSNYDTMSVDTEYNNVSTQIYYRLKFTANHGHCHSN